MMTLSRRIAIGLMTCLAFYQVLMFMTTSTADPAVYLGYAAATFKAKNDKDSGPILTDREKNIHFWSAVFPFLVSYLWSPCTNEGSGKVVTTAFPRTSTFKQIFRYGSPEDRPANDENAAAVCAFVRHPNKSSCQYDHAMQQLYKCFSWWQLNSNQRAVLTIKPTWIERCLRDKVPFVNGFLDALVEAFHVEIVPDHPDPAVTFRSNTRVALSSSDMPTLRDGILANLRGQSDDDTTKIDCGAPRIAVLERKGSRAFGRPFELAMAMQTAMEEEHKNMSVPVHYFEGKSFDEQVGVMSTTDILFSPHGAQLSALPFMPPNGAVLEFFPEGYLYEDHFGQIAAASGLEHNYIYMGNEAVPVKDQRPIRTHSVTGLMKRATARRVRLCPAVDTVVHAARFLVSKWEERCCLLKGC